MYKLEITTNDKIETLVFSEELDTWKEVKEEIDYFKELKLVNINLMIYKENKEKELDYLGEFYNIQPREKEQKTKKKLKTSTKIMILEILLFPFMLLKEIIKEQ